MAALLDITNVTKNYGLKTALNNVTFSLEQGRILGLMGPNGSGKTTLLKVLSGVQHPASGEVLVDGKKVGVETKSMVSFLPDVNPLFSWMKADDAIDFYKDFFDDFDKVKCYELLDFMKLNRTQKVRSMSKGMIEKLNLSLVFSRKARLFLLDEPLGGVDPVARERIVSTIIKTYSEDSSIIISTHLVHDVEAIFDDICMINEGEIILQGSAEDLRSEHAMSIDQLYIKMFADKI